MTFLRRFIEALELSLSKLDAIVVGTSSSLGRMGEKEDRGSCIACDRPLRMRMTSTPLGKLQQRVLQNQELSPKTKRKKLQGLTSTSPSFHSNPYTTTTVGKKSQGMKGAGDHSSHLGIDHLQATLESSDPSAEKRGNEIADYQEDGQVREDHEVKGEDTAVLPNELRKLIKSTTASQSTATAIVSYSKSTTKRPKSACGVVNSAGKKERERYPLTSTSPAPISLGQSPHIPNTSGSNSTSKYIKRSGYKMKLSSHMSQERLIESLTSNFIRDISIPSSHSSPSLATPNVYLPSPDIRRLDPESVREKERTGRESKSETNTPRSTQQTNSVELLNLSSYIQNIP
jgi:hypothetical protein